LAAGFDPPPFLVFIVRNVKFLNKSKRLFATTKICVIINRIRALFFIVRFSKKSAIFAKLTFPIFSAFASFAILQRSNLISRRSKTPLDRGR
jgi:hypothetical protein